MSLLKGAAAGMACVAMQVPYALTGDAESAGAVGSTLMHLVPVEVDVAYDGYDNHWWWDNVAHFFGGYAVGTALSCVFDDRETVLKAFLVVTGAWEVFEYGSRERPWHVDENGDMEWSFDHAMEDTALDTVMGLAGAYAATR